MENRAVVSAREKARKAEVFARLVPARGEMMQSRLGEAILSSWQTNGSRAAALAVSSYERDIFPLPCCPTHLLGKGCRRTQQTNGRRRLVTELALALKVPVSLCVCMLSPRIKEHSALWRHRQSTGPSERQGTCAAPSALLKGMSDYSSSSSPRKLASHQKTDVSLPGVHDCPRILDVVGSTGRCYVEEKQQRMRRDPEEIEVAALPQVHNDTVLKRNQNLYHTFVRYEVTRSPTVSPGTRWCAFCANVQRRATPDVGRQTIKRPLSAPSWCATAVF